MIITDDFVFIHFPKTGGLFIAEVLKKAYAQKRWFWKPPLVKELMLPNVKRKNGSRVYNQHGTWEQIPAEHKHKPIVSSIRNPYDRYVSTFEFQSWVNRPSEELLKIKELFPSFPELSFEQYLLFANKYEIENRAFSDLLKVDIGVITYTFIQFFFKNTMQIINDLNEEYINSSKYNNDMPEIRFLHTENLNCDLYNMLLQCGFRKKEISFIIDEKRVNVTPNRKKERGWEEYYDEKLFGFIKFKERFLLRVFPEYNVGLHKRSS